MLAKDTEDFTCEVDQYLEEAWRYDRLDSRCWRQS